MNFNNNERFIKMKYIFTQFVNLIKQYVTVVIFCRATEINQMKKRFPSFEIISENQTYSVLFQPSDPDWVRNNILALS